MRTIISTLLLCLSCSREDDVKPSDVLTSYIYISKTEMNLKRYVIKQGNKDTSPPTIPTLFNFKGAFLKASRLRWAYKIDESWWYEWLLPDGTIDQDRNDYWKIIGASAGLTKPMNHEAVILACHPDGDINNKLIRFTIYRNFDGGKFDVAENESRSWTVPLSDDKVRICEMYKKNPKSDILNVFITNLDGTIDREFQILFPFDSGKTVFLWFGGQNNSEGPYGDTASQDIIAYIRNMHS